MENKVNPNGVNNENEAVKKAAPPPMKRVKKGEQSAAVKKAAKNIEEKKNTTSAKKAEAKEQIKEEVQVAEPVTEEKSEASVAVTPEIKKEPKEETAVASEIKKEKTTPIVAPEIKKNETKPEKPVKEKKPVITAVPVKEKVNSKNLKVIIPVIALILVAIIVAVVLVSGDKKPESIVVTDGNGVPLTDVNGEPITVIPEETEVVVVTDANGNAVKDSDGKDMTTVVYKDVVVQVPVTDMNGAAVTDTNGNVVTENINVNPNVSGSTTNSNNIGTSSVLVTDGKGNTGVDEQGNPITTIINITEAPTIDVEPAKTEWKNTQGGSADDKYKDVILTNDGCYITANATNSRDGDFAEYKDMNLSTPYTVLTKYDKEGKIVWQKVYGSENGSLELVALSPAENGSFYAVGYGKAIENLEITGWYDGAIYKIDKDGNVDWVKKFGTSTVDILNDVVTAKNGDAIVVGSSGNNDGDAKNSGGKANESKALIMRYSSSGKLLWREFAGGNMDTFVGVAEGSDGSIFALGNFYSGKLFPALGKCDSGVVKYSSDGDMMAKTSIAGTGIDEFKGITASSDGGIVVCGTSDSADEKEDSFFKNDLASRGGYDSYIIKYTNDLTTKFVTPVRGQNNDIATSVIELSNGNYIMAGSTNSSTRDFKGITTRGKKDIFIASFNKNGTLIWVRSFGGTENDGALALCRGGDGGYVVVGESLSKNVDLQGIAPYGGNGRSLAVMVKFPE